MEIDLALDEEGVTATATAATAGQTGVEMEALTAVSVTLLTVYDMAKALDKRMTIGDIRLIAKTGGKSGLARLTPPIAGNGRRARASLGKRSDRHSSPRPRSPGPIARAGQRAPHRRTALARSRRTLGRARRDRAANPARAGPVCDGRLCDPFQDMPGPWTVIGESAAGRPFGGSVERGQATRIFTGAALPQGADTVLIQEEAARDGAALTLAGEGPGHRGRNVRRRGLDFSEA